MFFAALDNLDRSDLRLVLVGGREIRDGYVEELVAKWPQWAVKLPPIPLEQMPEVVAAAHVVVVPQRQHPTALAQFPMKLTDAMAMCKTYCDDSGGRYSGNFRRLRFSRGS